MQVTLKGRPCQTNGTLPKVGTKAKDFTLVDKSLNEKSLKDFPGNKLILTVPSLDTGVCLTSAKKFNELAKGLTVLFVSADLPFAGARVCGSENLTHVHTLSMMANREFAADYGVLLTDGPLKGLSSRSVIALDEENKVIYTELVEEISNEPDYEKAINAFS